MLVNAMNGTHVLLLLVLLTARCAWRETSASRSSRRPSTTDGGSIAQTEQVEEQRSAVANVGSGAAAASNLATRPMKRLRILCLHGYNGNAEVMRDQMRALVTGTETLAEYISVDAPSLAVGDFGWWHAVDDPNATGRGDPGVDGRVKYYKGWQRTRDWLVSVFAQRGPFDGVLGFSQGAALTGLMVGMRAPAGKTTPEHPLAFDFATIVSGFRSNDPSHAVLYASKESFDLPSLHIIGRSDFIVPPAESFELASAFASPTILQHGGGHVIASTSEIRDRYRRFLEEMR